MAENQLFQATAMPDRDWWQALWPDPLATLAAIGIKPGMTVVDLCCGDGYFTFPLAKLTGERVYALDLDPDHIIKGVATAATENIYNITWMGGDACQVDQRVPEPVDFVLLANTFHGVPDQKKLVTAIAGALKPGGQLAIVNWHPRPREETTILGQARGPATELRMSPDAVTAITDACGFQMLAQYDIGPYHYGVLCALRRQVNQG